MGNKKLITILSIVVVAGLLFIYAKQGMFDKEESTDTDYGVEGAETINSVDGYGVSASHPLAVKAGMDVLEKGGNAADAAVAVSYVLGVVEPYGSGVGGGGEMLYLKKNDEQPTVFEYREVAPKSGAEPDSFAIPGFVKGMEDLNEKEGSGEMTMKELLDPAIKFAEEGFEADKYLVERLKKGSHRMDVASLPQFFPEGSIIEVNDILEQHELAETLRAIQKDGSDGFYSGEVAEQILDHEEAKGIKQGDLTDYKSNEADAAHGKFDDYDVYAAPPPLAGVTLIQSLQMAEQLNIASTEDNKQDYIHLIGEISKRTYDKRIKDVGDVAFADPDYAQKLTATDELTSAEYTKEMAKTISLDKLSDDYEVNDSISDEEDHDNTTHFVIVDKEGTMVSATHTLGNFFGSGANVGGFFMNNQMENFGESDSPLNSIERGKTPRSFTSPAILRNDDKTKTIGIGSPGGKRIPMVMTEVLIRHLLFDEPLEEAVAAKRFYIEDNDLTTETELDKDVQSGLRARGYEIYKKTDPEFYGGIQALVIDQKAKEIYGAADERRGGISKVKENKK